MFIRGGGVEERRKETEREEKERAKSIYSEVLAVAQWDQWCLCSGRDMGSIPGPAQWLKDPARSLSLALELHMRSIPRTMPGKEEAPSNIC